ncbi:MAG: glycosyltransferase family 1 protein [Patescibacteria group bacterium]
MKIGIDARLWNESGVGKYTRNLVEQLQIIDRKNEYMLFVLSQDRKKILNQVQNDNFSIVNADIRWHTLEEQMKFSSIINKEDLDLMHFTYPSVPIFYNKPFIVTIHDLILHHFPTGEASTLALPLYYLKHFAYKLVILQAAKKAKRIIAVSKATKKEIIDHLRVPEKKVVVIYEGVSNEITNPKSQIPNKSQNPKYKILNTKYFLYVGNAYPHKNLERMLMAFASIKYRVLSIKLVFVGREDYFYKRLKEKVKNMGLGKSVNFLGEVSDDELICLYRDARALVIPSLMEGFGLPALEAMANKCLVLASDIPSLKEVCGNAAIYFDPYGIDDISKKMIEVYSNDINHYSSNINKGFEKTKIFSWEKMTRETLKVYESCVGG